MYNVSFGGRIEIRHFKNGVMSKKHIFETTKEKDQQIYNCIHNKFNGKPVLGDKNAESVISFLKNMVENITGEKLPMVDSKECYFAFLPKSLLFQKGITKDPGMGDAYSVYILT